MGSPGDEKKSHWKANNVDLERSQWRKLHISVNHARPRFWGGIIWAEGWQAPRKEVPGTSSPLLMRVRHWHIRGMLSRWGPLFPKDVNTVGGGSHPLCSLGETWVGVLACSKDGDLFKNRGDYNLGPAPSKARHQIEMRLSHQAGTLT